MKNATISCENAPNAGGATLNNGTL